MTPRFRRLLVSALGLLASGGAAAAQISIPPSYKIHDLGVLPGNHRSYAYGINDALQVVGDSRDDVAIPPVVHAFRWEAGVMTDLGALPGGKVARAVDINAAGKIAGWSAQNPTGFAETFSAFVYDGSMTALPFPGGLSLPSSYGNDIADSGAVVGTCPFNSGLPTQAALWLPNAAAPFSLGVLETNGRSEAFGVNANGWVVGEATTLGHLWVHAFAWDNSSMKDLGTLSGGPQANSRAFDVNNLNQVVGESETGPNSSHAFFWSEGVGVMLDLGALGGGVGLSRAHAINNSARIVGTGSAPDVIWHAILWHAGAVYDLNQLVTPANHGWGLVSAEDINDQGYIVGYGFAPGAGGNIHAFLLEPWPRIVEPVPILTPPSGPIKFHF